MLIFKCFLVQVGNFISYGVCKFICLLSFMYNRFHKELRFFFSLLKRKKEAKKEKSSRFTCTVRQMHHPKITQETFLHRFLSTKIPRRGIQAAAAAVTLPFSQLKLGRKVSGDPPLSLLKRKKEAKKEKSSHFPCTVRFQYHPKIIQEILTNKNPPAGRTGGCRRRNITLFTVEIGA